MPAPMSPPSAFAKAPARRFDELLEAGARQFWARASASCDDALEQGRVPSGRKQERRGPHIGPDRVQTADAEMYCEFDDEVSHRLGRHHVRAASGAAEARKVHQDQWAKLLDRGQDSAKGIDALR